MSANFATGDIEYSLLLQLFYSQIFLIVLQYELPLLVSPDSDIITATSLELAVAA